MRFGSGGPQGVVRGVDRVARVDGVVGASSLAPSPGRDLTLLDRKACEAHDLFSFRDRYRSGTVRLHTSGRPGRDITAQPCGAIAKRESASSAAVAEEPLPWRVIDG